jgi:hypothetical protein
MSTRPRGGSDVVSVAVFQAKDTRQRNCERCGPSGPPSGEPQGSRHIIVKNALVVLLFVTLSASARGFGQTLRYEFGQSVTPSFEGWFENPDGSVSLSFGYMNRNFRQELDLPIGPANRFEPGPPDVGQPTHFMPRRQTGVFVVVVSKEVAANKNYSVTWTLTSNGQTNSVPGHLRPEWKIEALGDVLNYKPLVRGNTPPTIRFASEGASGQGPGGISTVTAANVSIPLPLNVWVTDDDKPRARIPGIPMAPAPPLGVTWSVYRGNGNVSFGEREPKIEGGKASTTATFARPGEYILRVLAWDRSGKQEAVMAAGMQCCWTNGYLKVNVTGDRSLK